MTRSALEPLFVGSPAGAKHPGTVMHARTHTRRRLSVPQVAVQRFLRVCVSAPQKAREQQQEADALLCSG
jgi:hypothetical protein